MTTLVTLIKPYSMELEVKVESSSYALEGNVYIMNNDNRSGDAILKAAREDAVSLTSLISSYKKSFIKRLHFLFTGEMI